MIVTVAICTWNRADLLDQTLCRLLELRIPEGVEWELIIVDNNCTDHTVEVIDRHKAALPIRYILETRQGHSHARNCALEHASGDLILWTDDDVLVDPEWLVEFLGAAERYPDAAGFGGPIEPWFPVPPDQELVAAFPSLKRGFCGHDLGMSEEVLREEAQLVGANMGHRIRMVGEMRYDTRLGMAPIVGVGGESLAVGGYEEYDLNNRMRARGHFFVWVPTMRVRHYVDPARMTLDYLRAFYSEYGRLSIRSDGMPAGTRVFGVPRWLLRASFESKVRSALCRFRSRRVESLENLRQHLVYRGMILECLAMRRAKSPRSSM